MSDTICIVALGGILCGMAFKLNPVFFLIGMIGLVLVAWGMSHGGAP